jgi:hypothetical protein
VEREGKGRGRERWGGKKRKEVEGEEGRREGKK